VKQGKIFSRDRPCIDFFSIFFSVFLCPGLGQERTGQRKLAVNFHNESERGGYKVGDRRKLKEMLG